MVVTLAHQNRFYRVLDILDVGDFAFVLLAKPLYYDAGYASSYALSLSLFAEHFQSSPFHCVLNLRFVKSDNRAVPFLDFRRYSYFGHNLSPGSGAPELRQARSTVVVPTTAKRIFP
jgi:hypothetical protein